MTLVLILATALILIYCIMAAYLYYGFKKRFSL
jgi:hypothetical protein